MGDFQPSVVKTSDFEVCVKHYVAGESEPRHYQRTATEITVIISGEALIGGTLVGPNAVVTIFPGEVCGFEALTDVVLTAVKFPSLPDDKRLEGQ